MFPLWEVGKFAKKMGIETKLNLVESIALGSSEVTPLELTSAYATIANKGIHNKPYPIIKIEDQNGVIINYFTAKSNEALSEETAYIICDMMKSVINNGTAAAARSRYGFRRPAAGKTGTTSDYADRVVRWFYATICSWCLGRLQ